MAIAIYKRSNIYGITPRIPTNSPLEKKPLRIPLGSFAALNNLLFTMDSSTISRKLPFLPSKRI